MTIVSIIILTHNEEIHIERCILSLIPLTVKILVIDSFSTDRTVEIAQSLGAKVFQRQWKNYADQFAWGITQCEPESTWLMRMDADEYLEPGLLNEILELMNSAPPELMGIYFKRKVFFRGKWIKHGGFYPQILLRVWRKGYGKIEQRWMDEHVVLPSGAITIIAKGGLVDDNRKGMTFWVNKHNNYASREAVDLLNNKYHFLVQDQSLLSSDNLQARRKRFIKENIYIKMPVGFRAFVYFFYRYLFLLGFLDGPEGFIWHFMQGFWYRLLVDIKINEIEDLCKGDVDKMKKIFITMHGLDIS